MSPAKQSKRHRLGESTFKRKALAAAAFLIFAASLLNALLGERGLFGLMKAREEYRAQLLEVAELRASNEALQREISALRSDPLTVERIAREVLGMARASEIVVEIRRPD